MSQKLTPKQIQAVELLARGDGINSIARSLKIRRETLSRWKHSPEFIVEFDRLMLEMQERMQLRMLHLVDSAISAVTHELSGYGRDSKRIQMALTVLKLLGIEPMALLNGVGNGPNARKQLEDARH